MTDEELVRVVQTQPGSPAARDAAAELLGRYQQAVYLRSLRYVKDTEQAMDMAQDVLMNAYQNIATFAGKSKFSSWLFAITRNRCLNEIKRLSLFHDDEPDPDAVATGNPGPDALVEERESEDRILDLLKAALDPLEQKAIWLRCYERLPVDEITRLLDIESSSGARGVLQRARRKLRAAVSEEGFDERAEPQ